MSQHQMTVRFWGVRGSYPVPGPGTVKYGGNTACVEISTPDHLVILDAGTGIIPLGEEIVANYRKKYPQNSEKLKITILITHTHHDHIQGLPFFHPIHLGFCSLYIYGPQLLGEDLEESLSISMEPRYCPVRLEEMNSEKIINNMSENDVLILKHAEHAPLLHKQINLNGQLKLKPQDLFITAYHSYAHPKDGVLIFRISMNGKSVVYATDTEGYTGGDTRLINFARDADLLIHDAQYLQEEYTDPAHPKQGYGHSTVDMACEVARKANVDRLVLFHHDPTHDDAAMDSIENYAQTLFPKAIAGREGMVITL